MINYKKISVDNLNQNAINNLYLFLIKNKFQFLILNNNSNLFVLTKEKTIFKIDNEFDFVNIHKKDIYYKTNVINKEKNINLQDLQIFKNYIKKYKKHLYKTKCNKYIFGCIAVKTNNGFITTIRGK